MEMKTRLFFAAALLLLCVSGCVQVIAPSDYTPGETVDSSVVAEIGIDSFFFGSEICPSVFERMKGKSFKEECPLPLESLRYLRVLHKDIEGRTFVGEMVVSDVIEDDVLYILKELYKASYPIEKMLLVDDFDAVDELSMRANNSSSFNFRFISGTTKISLHGQGLAVDINPLYNPYFKLGPDGPCAIEPSNAGPYTDRSVSYPYKIEDGDLCCRLFKSRGFDWGGDWITVKDYQHFEKRQP